MYARIHVYHHLERSHKSDDRRQLHRLGTSGALGRFGSAPSSAVAHARLRAAVATLRHRSVALLKVPHSAGMAHASLHSFDADAWADRLMASRKYKPPSIILVLAGGVSDDDGTPHESVLRRLQATAALVARREECVETCVVCVGGGTSHKPKWCDEHGFAVPEAQLMARQLAKMGVPLSRCVLESLSDDTIGNLLFARLLHTDARPSWRDVLVITSAFQAPRAAAIADWVFALTPAPSYTVACAAVPDEGAVDASALEGRVAREAGSLESFQRNVASRISTLEEAHAFIFQQHDAYRAREPVAKDTQQVDAATLATY